MSRAASISWRRWKAFLLEHRVFVFGHSLFRDRVSVLGDKCDSRDGTEARDYTYVIETAAPDAKALDFSFTKTGC